MKYRRPATARVTSARMPTRIIRRFARRAGPVAPPRGPRLFVSSLRLAVFLAALASLADWRPRHPVRTAREAAIESGEPGPEWKVEPGFRHDVFTFARIQYTPGRWGWRGSGQWWIDFPDSDLNLSFRLQQLTSLRVDPDGRVLRLTDPDLFHYPWIYIVEPGELRFEEEEVSALRRYLLNGGFLMFDDFWGEDEWNNLEQQMKRVFPDRAFVELPLDHPIYSCVFPIRAKGQVPNVRTGIESQFDGVTWERWDAKEVHHRALLDDKGRILAIACHNTDNGDGWEREAWSDYYFHNFSEKIAYPLGINIIFYAMTH